jgi:hypothetical protein
MVNPAFRASGARYAAVVFRAPHDEAENAGLEVRRPFVMLRAGAIVNG